MKQYQNKIRIWNSKVILLFVMVFFLSSCTSVPKDSVELSREIGNGILESQRSYTNLLNTYFASKKQQIDYWIENEYLPTYISNIQSELKKDGQTSILTPHQLTDILKDVIVERDQKHTDLENTRLLLLTKSNEHFGLLLQSNSSNTGLLQSMVDIKEATSSSKNALKSVSEEKINIEQIEYKFNEYLKKSGAASAKTTSLYDKVKSELEKKGE